MGILAWIVLGLIAGFIGSKIVNRRGEGILLDVLLGIVGAITGEGTLLSAAEVKALAMLPTRDQLIGQLVGTIAAPLTGFVGVLSGNVRSIINVLQALASESEK